MGLARMITSIEVNGLPLDYVESFAGKVRALTAAEVSATIKQYVKNDDIVILVFTTDSVTRKQLEGLGSIQVKNYLD
jgi:predicted Zn-dependent peptidase